LGISVYGGVVLLVYFSIDDVHRTINLREEIIKNKGTIKRNWQHMVHKTKATKTQHNIRWTSLSGNKHKERKEDGHPATNNWR
jgi:hypothetical protein